MKKLIYIATILIALLTVAPVVPAYAALPGCTGNDAAICETDQSLLGGILKDVINVMLYMAGAIAVIMIVVGGIRYITSDGDPGAAGKAKNTIIYAIVGIVIASMSYAIVNFVIDKI